MNYIKKTFSVNLGTEDILIALMKKLDFEEIERNVTGGYMSEEKIQLTFGGWDEKYNEDSYIKEKSPNDGFFYFYSLRSLTSFYTNKLETFKAYHEKQKREFEIFSLNEPE